jgi:hypothetical protein
MKTKYVWSSVVPHNIKVELSSCDISHIQIRCQDTFARKVGTSEYLPKRIDDATTHELRNEITPSRRNEEEGG